MLYVFLLVAISLHIFQAYSLQFVLEGDESVVLYWGARFWQEGWSGFFSQNDVALWETPAAWLFGGFEWFTGFSARWLALVLSWFSLFLWYKIFKNRFSSTLSLVGVFLLATSPYYTFFALSLGPLNIYWILSLYIWSYERHGVWIRMLALLAGLFFYAYFRIVWIFDFVTSIVRRDLRSVSRSILIAFFYFTVLSLSGEMHRVFEKGGYLLARGSNYAMAQYIQSLLIWITPAWRNFRIFREHSFLDLGRAFVDLVFPDTVLGSTHTLLLILSMLFMFRRKTDRCLIPSWVIVVTVLSLIFAGWSATLVHLAAVAPLFIVFMMPALSRLMNYPVLLILVFMGALGSSVHFSMNLGQQKTPVLSPVGDLVFKKWEEQTLGRSSSSQPKLLVLVGNEYFFIRYYQEKWKRYYSQLPAWDIDFYSSQDQEDLSVEGENLSRRGYTHLAIVRPQFISDVPPTIKDLSEKAEKAYRNIRFHLDYTSPNLVWQTLLDRSGRPQVDWLELP